jgi:hypothetical protein
LKPAVVAGVLTRVNRHLFSDGRPGLVTQDGMRLMTVDERVLAYGSPAVDVRTG